MLGYHNSLVLVHHYVSSFLLKCFSTFLFLFAVAYILYVSYMPLPYIWGTFPFLWQAAWI